MVRVLITRPEPGATLTLNALISRGIDAATIPLTEIQPLAFSWPVGDFDGLIITSQNAVRYGADVLALHLTLPVFVVGKRTSDTLRSHQIAASAETAQGLLPAIINHMPKNLLYICGQNRRPELETALRATGINVEALEVYAANPTKEAGKSVEAFFSLTQNAIIVFHAPSAAQAFVKATKSKKLANITRFLCMSAAIAAELPLEWQEKVSLAGRPDEAAMIKQLDKMLARDPMPKA